MVYFCLKCFGFESTITSFLRYSSCNICFNAFYKSGRKLAATRPKIKLFRGGSGTNSSFRLKKGLPQKHSSSKNFYRLSWFLWKFSHPNVHSHCMTLFYLCTRFQEIRESKVKEGQQPVSVLWPRGGGGPGDGRYWITAQWWERERGPWRAEWRQPLSQHAMDQGSQCHCKFSMQTCTFWICYVFQIRWKKILKLKFCVWNNYLATNSMPQKNKEWWYFLVSGNHC